MLNTLVQHYSIPPFDDPPLPNLRCSGLGAIPKHDGGWWIIYHLSAPPGLSINDLLILIVIVSRIVLLMMHTQ